LKPGQRGQALVESAIALPVLMLLFLGTVQLGLLVYSRIMLQHAAHCAARAYTAWEPEDAAVALEKADAAAWLALRGTPQPVELQVTVLPDDGRFLGLIGQPEFRGSGPLFHRLTVEASWRPLLRLPFWNHDFILSADGTILSENTRERSPS
jgi:hypothetical protein